MCDDDVGLLSGLVGGRRGADDVALRQRDGRPYLVLRNEFATVWLGIDRTANGVRVLVTDPETDTVIALDPLELEAISRMTHQDFDDRILERGPGTPKREPTRAVHHGQEKA
ncbi:hypothetical protein [Egicoccus sp. AB-alg6-2]|uniref:hypothetical protein n=1 Tax=Egicoccus sp. AB-alg6-2 TaxID=3242692 RepID=UPI00359E3537